VDSDSVWRKTWETITEFRTHKGRLWVPSAAGGWYRRRHHQLQVPPAIANGRSTRSPGPTFTIHAFSSNSKGATSGGVLYDSVGSRPSYSIGDMTCTSWTKTNEIVFTYSGVFGPFQGPSSCHRFYRWVPISLSRIHWNRESRETFRRLPAGDSLVPRHFLFAQAPLPSRFCRSLSRFTCEREPRPRWVVARKSPGPKIAASRPAASTAYQYKGYSLRFQS
jgi:hypothetical protein